MDLPAPGMPPAVADIKRYLATVLADGRNEAITYTAPTSGTYYVKVSRQNFTEGDYVLDPEESDSEATSAVAPAPATGGALK